MNRRLTMLLSSFEALMVLGIGIAIPLLPATVLWAAHYGFAPDWAGFWRGAVDVWLIGHGVDVTFTLDPVMSATIGAPADTRVLVSIAALGFGLVTLLMGVRAGGRVAETGHRLLGELTCFGVFAVASFLVTLSARDAAAMPSLWQGTLFPAAIFGAGLLLGVLRAGAETGPDANGSSLRDWIADWPPRIRSAVGAGLTTGAAAVAITLLVSALAVVMLLVTGYAQAIRLYEALHTEVLGGVIVTAAQLAFMPNLVLWAASWFVGPGFALGVGSQVSPLATAVGPLPAIPVLGVLPTGSLDYGFVGLAVPILAGFLAAIGIRARLVRGLGSFAPFRYYALTTAVAGVFGGLLLGILTAWSAGAFGPGRFSEVGPDGVAVGIAAGIEFAVGVGLGLASALLPSVGSLTEKWGAKQAR